MILADTTYAGQLNVPDMFTRMMLSLVATGIAPGSFYELDADGNRQRAHFDGLPVEFIADAISTLGGARARQGFQTYHVMNPYDDGIGLDAFVDWLIEAGYPINRIADYADWLARFETTLRALPEKQRQALAAAAAAQLPVAASSRSTGQWRLPTIPGGGPGREDRSRQGHSAPLGPGHRQVRHRSAVARTALRRWLLIGAL